MRAIRVLLLSAILVQPAAAQQMRLVADSGRFLLAGKPYQIISGEMHYPRVPREYWRDRMRKARALGLNTISTYVFWNVHERSPGTFDFTGQRNIAEYIRIAQEEGLNVILRPGPYVCAEWDLGGYPSWLLANPNLVLRSTDTLFTRVAERWLDRLGQELTPLLAARGGPIIAVQVENEYGSFDRDSSYMRWQRNALEHAGFTGVMLYTADGDVQLRNGTLPDLPAVVNFGTGDADSAFARLQRFRPKGPLMTGEYWAGWFDHWGRAHSTTNLQTQMRELSWMLERGYSVNLYLFHGGTTFGFLNGANIDNGRYFPQTTSYDYDAALDESGRPTQKYFGFRDVIGRRKGVEPSGVPPTPLPIAIPQFTMNQVGALWRNLPPAQASERPRSMETFGQSFGYIVYRTRVQGPAQGQLVVHDVRDYAQVYVNGKFVGTLDRRLRQDSLPLILPAGRVQLDILVENSGRVNFTKALRDERKGITREVLFDGKPLLGWQVYTLPMPEAPRPRYAKAAVKGPAYYRGTFSLTRSGDTFLDTSGWGKGTVWVNGHHLGRFWSIGPQQTLYVPGVWLKRGANEVIVFALTEPTRRTMAGLPAPILNQLIK